MIGCTLQKQNKEDEIHESLSACNASSFIKYSEFKSYFMLKTTSDIVNETQCKPNCVTFKYELAKKLYWNVKVGDPSKITFLKFRWIFNILFLNI